MDSNIPVPITEEPIIETMDTDKKIKITKNKKTLTEKQKVALEKGRNTRKNNIITKKVENAKEIILKNNSNNVINDFLDLKHLLILSIIVVFLFITHKKFISVQSNPVKNISETSTNNVEKQQEQSTDIKTFLKLDF
jgi:hypothetical protein